MVVSCGNGVTISAQSSKKEGAGNRDIVSCRRPGPSSEYKGSLIIIIRLFFLGNMSLDVRVEHHARYFFVA